MGDELQSSPGLRLPYGELDVVQTEVERLAARPRLVRDAARHEAIDEIDVALDDLITRLDASDELTAEHSRAVSSWCARLAHRLALAKHDAIDVARAGLIHDVGKITTPSAILNAPRALDDDEMAIMRDHAVAGAKMVAAIPLVAHFTPAVRNHHERFDGRGYPDGLRASTIPIATRIVTVADAFNAMIGRRPYRPPFSPAVALERLEANRGTQFDPIVVDAMIDVVTNRNLAGTTLMRKGLQLPALATLLVASIFAGCAGGGMSSALPAEHGSKLYALTQSRALPAESPTPTPSPTPAPQGGLLGGLLGGVLGIVGGVLGAVGCVASLSNAGCHVSLNTSVHPTSTYQNGLGAADIWSAYGLPAPARGAVANGRTIAIVSAFAAPNAESDLAAYRKAFGMPACTSSNGCFKEINQAPPSTTPAPAWTMETDIDLAMASVGCPTCRLLLVEAASSDLSALAAAEDAAAEQHPAAISNSYGVPESADSETLASHWNHPGIAITASTGDAKIATFPATLASVTAVGGTVLAKDRSARGWSETAWANSGAGCSTLEAKPDWQTDAYGCTSRAVADVSAVATANPGIAVYDRAVGGWVVVTGTSVATPLIAGIYGAAGDYPSDATGAPGVYAKASALHHLAGSFSQGTPAGLTAF